MTFVTPVLCLVFLLSFHATADVKLSITDQQGQPLEDAVVELLDPANKTLSPTAHREAETAKAHRG